MYPKAKEPKLPEARFGRKDGTGCIEIHRTQERGYEAKRPHMAPYLQNASGCHNRSLGISVFHVNSWVKPQNQLAMTSQGADQPLCQVEEQHSQEASRGASEAGQKDLP